MQRHVPRFFTYSKFQIRDVTRPEISHRTVLNFGGWNGWNYKRLIIAGKWGGVIRYYYDVTIDKRDSRRDIFYYIVYEHDGFPNVTVKKHTISSPGGLSPRPTSTFVKNTITLDYLSSDESYAFGTMSWYKGVSDYVCGTKIDNGCMKMYFKTGVGIAPNPDHKD